MNSTKKPNCVLHIGMPKTGSSSIQNALQHYVSDTVEYLDLGHPNHSTFMFSLFSDKPESHHGHSNIGRTKEEVQAINKRNLEKLTTCLKKTQAKSVIISGEDIIFLRPHELERLKAFFDDHVARIEIIAYVRAPIAYMQSAFQQHVKGGLGSFEPETFYPHYQRLFKRFDQVFGNERVHLYKYDAASLIDSNVVVDFCHRIGIEDSIIFDKATRRDNTSLSLEATAFLFVYNKFFSGYGYGDLKAAKEILGLIEAISKVGNKKICFSRTFADSILETKREDIEWMESRLECSLQESLTDLPDSIGSEQDILNLSAEYANDLNRLLLFHMQQHPATPQKVAEWMHLLRLQLANPENIQTSPIFSAVQVEQSKLTTDKMSLLLKDIFLEITLADPQLLAKDLRDKIMPLLQVGIEEPIDTKQKISFSVDLYQNGSLLGWIVNKSEPSHKLEIEIYSTNGIIGKGCADLLRKDLVGSVSEDGCCAFVIPIDSAMTDFGSQLVIRVVDYNKYFYIKCSSIKGLT